MRLVAAPLATPLNSGKTRGRMLRGWIRRSGSDHELRRLPTSPPETGGDVGSRPVVQYQCTYAYNVPLTYRQLHHWGTGQTPSRQPIRRYFSSAEIQCMVTCKLWRTVINLQCKILRLWLGL